MAHAWAKLSIQQKIFAGLGVILALMAAMLAVEIRLFDLQTSATDGLVTHLVPARAEVRRLQELIVSADDDGAWYLLNDLPAAKASRLARRYRQDLRAVQASIRRLRRLVRPPEQRAMLARLQDAWATYVRGNSSAFSLAARGHEAEARTAYLAVPYQPSLQALAAVDADISARIDSLTAQRRWASSAARDTAVIFGLGTVALAIVVAVGLGGSLRRRLAAISSAIAEVVSSDVAQLAENFRDIAAGNVAKPRYVCNRALLEAIERDEIGVLAASYNGLIGGLQDISVRMERAVADAQRHRETEERLRYLQNHDALTGLANRQSIHACLESLIRARAHHPGLAAVAYVGLQGFKKVSDSFGNAAGDELVRCSAQRLRRLLRAGYMLARGAQDEFIVVLSNVESRERAEHLLNEMIDALAEPCTIDGREIVVNARAGLCLYPADGVKAEELLRNADTALDFAAASSAQVAVWYQPFMRQQSLERLAIERDLQRAVSAEEFEVYYQPIVDVARREIIGFEALLRWNHPALGVLTPASFLEVAEQTGIIDTLGTWVLRTACMQCKRWRDAGYDVTISVNVSPFQFGRGDLPQNVRCALDAASLPARCLELELTESTIVDDRHGAYGALCRLDELGVRIAIDDFGTGYSSFAYLRNFPAHTVKIDRSFVTDIATKAYDEAIVSAVILLAKMLGLRVIAEGVEERAQRDALRRLGCEQMQGYHFAPPVPAEQCSEILRSPKYLSFHPNPDIA